jgi:hypothetical protein
MEPSQANVRSIEALESVRLAMVECLDALGTALSEAQGEVGKAIDWVHGDRVPHWHRRVQRLAEEVNSARSLLFRKETVTSSKDSKPSVVDERKALARAKAMVEDAEDRGRRSKAWANAMPREQAILKRGLSALEVMVERELPQAIAMLGRMIEALEGYRGQGLPDLRQLIESDGAIETGAQGMARGASGEPEPPQGPAGPDAPAADGRRASP